jgi:hypothetical protein
MMDMKAILGILIATQLFGVSAVAETTVYEEPEVVIEEAKGGEEPGRSEEFMWFYRIYNGKQQMRLWSITYGYWATDWIDCE